MKALKRLRDVASTCLVAVVIAALTFVVAHMVFHPSDPETSLTSGSGFSITSNIYATSTCSGSTADLDPGTTRYICFTVQNNLTVPITVGSISMALSSNPPAGCAASDLSLPTYSGSLLVPGSASASTTGLPIALKDDGQQSPQCQNHTLGFVYTGSAQYTDSTSTSLASSSPANTSTHGASVTFTATVSETNANQDPSGSLAGGTVAFESCSSPACSGTLTLLGTGSIGSNGQATYATMSLPAGTNYIEAMYGGSGTNLAGSTSNVVTQTVTSGTISTTSSLTSSPNPSTSGTLVTFSDAVSASSGTPTGGVTFYSCTTACSTKTSLGLATLSGGKASVSTAALPVGTTDVEAIYAGSGNDSGSTSNVVAQVVLSVPSVCAAGGYNDLIAGTPANPFLFGTNGNDLIEAFGGLYWIEGYAGNDCIDAGDGNVVIFDGNGTDGVVAGNGSDSVILGNGNDKVGLGNGSDSIATGNGADMVTLGNGSGSEVLVGNGSDTVTVGTGSNNRVELGSGTETVTVQSSGSHDSIDGGAGNETIHLGSGTYNSYSGGKGKSNVCHLPSPPSSYHGSVAGYYHDTITNCTVVTP